MEEPREQDGREGGARPQRREALAEALRDLRLTFGIALLVGIGLILEGGQSPLQYAALGALLVVVSVIGLTVSFRNPRTTRGGPLGSVPHTQPPPALEPFFSILRASNTEDLLKSLVKLVFSIVLLIPLILLPLYFFFVTLLHL
jgi:hypothetical protein